MRIFIFLAFANFIVFSNAPANTHGVGNPGNAFDSQMVSACEKAYRILESDFWSEGTVPADLKDFFAKHWSKLRTEVKGCSLLFTDSVYPIELPGIDPSCARTNVAPELSGQPIDTIYLSRTTCINQGLDAEAALLLIFHENIHHLVDPAYSDRPDNRISDEAFCNTTASAIVNSWKVHVEGRPVKWGSLPVVPDQAMGRAHHTSVVTTDEQGDFSKVVMWGGCYGDEFALFGCNRYLRSGLQFDLKSADWALTEEGRGSDFRPDERAYHSAVWTGSDALLPQKMVIWGGCNGTHSCFNSLNDGAVFDPEQKEWTPLNDEALNRPSPRTFHSSVWTGRGMFIWGGLENFDSPTPGVTPKPLGNGGIWLPSATGEVSHWQEIPTAGQPSARSHHSTVWTGEDIIVWGGCKRFDLNSQCIETVNDGARFNIASMQWHPLPRGADVPAGRYGHKAYWTKSSMIIWGGEDAQGAEKTGALFSVALNRWFPMAKQPEIAGSAPFNATWAQDHLIAWAGAQNGSHILEYFPPAGDQLAFGGFWSVKPIRNSRDISAYGTFEWTPQGILQWGGETTVGEFPDSAGMLNF